MITPHKLVVDIIEFRPVDYDSLDLSTTYRTAFYNLIKLKLIETINHYIYTNQVQYKALVLSSHISNMIGDGTRTDVNTVFQLEVFTNDSLQDDVIVLTTDIVEVHNIDRILKLNSFLEE